LDTRGVIKIKVFFTLCAGIRSGIIDAIWNTQTEFGRFTSLRALHENKSFFAGQTFILHVYHDAVIQSFQF